MHDIHVEYIGASRNPTKRKRRVQGTPEAQPPNPQALATLSDDWRQLLTSCVKNGANARWQTWEKIAGLSRKVMLAQLRDWLLKHGWLSVYEEKHSGEWWAYKLEILHHDALQAALGLTSNDATQHLQSLLTQLNGLQHPALQAAIDCLVDMPASRAVVRAQLLLSLHDWQAQNRSGTYRDFALFARGNTKALTSAEWQWLDDYCDLTASQIERHTPLLLIAASVQLHTMQDVINLSAFADFVALTPASVQAVQRMAGHIKRWVLVENRTSFERMVKQRQTDEVVIWLPGYPPSWWRQAVQHLVALNPANVDIACDPDPAGIAIAWQVIQLFEKVSVTASPWQMDIGQLEELASKQALTAYDKQLLSQLLADENLPSALRCLALHMQQHQQKGEQEAYL